ncbi:HNH endonuclease [Vibrio hepatarius]|uniref:HNH endonuclease n=1 Tax=Vibrio hepatarius TaxID=171383 RepID=UPI0006A9B2CE|nr:HNH endonuclease signature motif containing protein [Vibrio hepatarius]
MRIDNYRCAYCGLELKSNTYGNIDHIKPKGSYFGQNFEFDNLIVICPACNARPKFTGVEFSNYLLQLLTKSKDYYDIVEDHRFDGSHVFEADITAKNNNRSLFFVCKSVASFVTSNLTSVIKEIESYRLETDFDYYVLAFPGILSSEQTTRLKKHNIVVWDARHIAKLFRTEIDEVGDDKFGYFYGLLDSHGSISQEEILVNKLRNCDVGIKSWSLYQKLVGEILEHLFCPPLNKPISESPDLEEANRRDWIIPNYSDTGFWQYLRDKYQAEYLVVDAKNHTKPIKKTHVLQMANYLKPHGAGMFGILVTRNGADKSSLLTIREQWVTAQKMIVVLTDSDVEAMLLEKAASGEPSNVLAGIIEKFRLSM